MTLLDALTASMTAKGSAPWTTCGKLALPAGHGAAAQERASYVSTLWAADHDGGSW
jgi:hypothetical protein